MNEDIFYKYNLYTLENKYTQIKFIEFLDTHILLNKSVEIFICDIINNLYELIITGEVIDISQINLPDIEKNLELILIDDATYISYKSISDQSLSEFVFNKFLQRIFKKDGHNNETHSIQNYIHAWLEQKLALNIVKDSRFKSLYIIKSLIKKTEMLENFYTYLIENISGDFILVNKEELVEINISSTKILDSMRMYDEEYFDNYEHSLKTQSKNNLWNYVQVATINSDYMMLNKEYSFRSSILIKNNISFWIKFWDNLKQPVIQDCIFHSFFNFEPKQYLQLVSSLIDKNTITKSDLNVLLLIVAQNYFSASYNLTEHFLIYEDSERKNKKNEFLFKLGIKEQKKWTGEKKKNYETLIISLQKKLPKSDIEDWIFSYRPKVINNYKPNEIYNNEINLLIEIYKERFDGVYNIKLNSFNLQKFNFYVEILKEQQDKNFSINLFEVVIEFISTKHFFWDKTYAEPYWSTLKGLGFILSLQDDFIMKSQDLIDKFKTVHQGWNSSKIDFLSLEKESFIYCSIVFVFENEATFENDSEKVLFFKRVLNHILMQVRSSYFDTSNHYEIPLHLLFLVSNQIFPEIKEYFETELIENYDNLYSLLTIISKDKIELADSSKKLLTRRLKEEFIFTKRKFGNRNEKEKIQDLDQILNQLNLENKNVE